MGEYDWTLDEAPESTNEGEVVIEETTYPDDEPDVAPTEG